MEKFVSKVSTENKSVSIDMVVYNQTRNHNRLNVIVHSLSRYYASYENGAFRIDCMHILSYKIGKIMKHRK